MEAFTAKDWEQLGKINNAGVKEAMDQMRTIMSSPDQRQLIWSRRLARMDYESQMHSERAEGHKEEKYGTARRMKARGFGIADIVDITGLSAEEVEQI